MAPDLQAERIRIRDRGGRTLRRVTLAVGALAAGITGILTAVTATASRTPAAVQPVSSVSSSAATVPAVPEPSATVSSGSAAAATPAPPASTPTPSSAPPAAVSGGS
jgi:hypothetical protein